MPQIHPEMYQSAPHDLPQRVVAYAADRMAEVTNPRHTHPRGQLLHIVSGTLAVETDGGTFVVPAERAVWMPPGVAHGTRTRAPTALRTIYVVPEAAPDLPAEPTVVRVTPLLRELILTLMSWPRNYDEAGPEGRLVSVLIDQIAVSPVAPLHLPMPQTERLRVLARELREDPADPRGLDALARAAAVSGRTLERRFREETGLTLRAWRRQAKLLKALELLADRQPVGLVAERLGYETTSAFIAMFRSAFGQSPGRYFEG
ncbi:AraC-like DNA-binding protein [Rhodobium orientis]|uniref:HTH araC/xylS-type domain-containing protein n=1 Tax=Rhodobium orientis TaxID=34017 RepID=A0A327JK66_9HYPH|nr:helix-turn-helix transcriptional regulator [Rhodobium orientis]MBB4301857.1 AraC-like DNA-binding protein [Rhodobium orientis]MBK5948369.1 hypothetical protein [Rhodobium orientis]RAI25202.1 hypothetical protein CH339_19195 [Rhodobium orientis]